MPNPAKLFLGIAFASSAAILAVPASAEVIEAKDGHFITRDEAVVEADLKQTWLALISPAKWWNASHTFTGDADNLELTPQAGGCFCETVPEIDEPDRFTLEGSVEHLRVVNSQPEVALRMIGALGPLQSEPVTGVLTIAMSEVDVDGTTATRIVWEYNVAGTMRFKTDVISKAVDGVMTQQLNGLAKLLGRVDAPGSESEESPEESADSDDVSEDGDATGSDAEAEERESVDDAFGDLEGNG